MIRNLEFAEAGIRNLGAVPASITKSGILLSGHRLGRRFIRLGPSYRGCYRFHAYDLKNGIWTCLQSADGLNELFLWLIGIRPLIGDTEFVSPGRAKGQLSALVTSHGQLSASIFLRRGDKVPQTITYEVPALMAIDFWHGAIPIDPILDYLSDRDEIDL